MNFKPRTKRDWCLAAALAVIVLLVIIVRLRLLQLPLERDEGEFAYAGQLMLGGVPPYQLAYNMKLPGTYGAYAVIMALFGQTRAGIHFGFLLVNLGAIALLFFIARRLGGSVAATMAAIVYALLALSPELFGLAGHATHLVALAALGGLLLLLRARDSGRGAIYFWSGLCFGLAFLFKQPGLYFGMFGFCILVSAETQSRPLGWAALARKVLLYGAGVALPVGLTCLALWRWGTFDRFWFWTFTYARVHAGLLTGGIAWLQFLDFWQKAGWAKWTLPLAALALAGLLCQKNKSARNFLLATLLGFSLLAFAAAFYFSRHYYIVMLPVVGLLIALAVTAAADALARSRRRGLRFAPAALFTVACACFIFQHRAAWFQMTPEALCRLEYGSSPFPESIVIARYIREHSAPDARVAVIGSEPQIYFYAHRRSATGYIYMYDLVQLHRYAAQMQRDLIRDVENVKPEFLVLVNVSSSWLIWPGSDSRVLDWSWQYAHDFYNRAGVVYIYPDHTDYVWGRESLQERSDTPFVVGVYQRK